MEKGLQVSPPVTLLEARTARFYAWEKRGRGWQVWGYPVDLEPPFVPFWHTDAATSEAHDDGRHPADTVRVLRRLSYGAGSLLGILLLGSKEPLLSVLAAPFFIWPFLYASRPAAPHEDRAAEGESDPDDEPAPAPASQEADELVSFEVILPPDTPVSDRASLQLLLALKYLERPIAYELVGADKSVSVQFTCHRDDREQVHGQLAAHFPEAQCVERDDAIGVAVDRLLRERAQEAAVIDFGLSEEFMLPIAIADLKADPLTAFVGALSGLREPDMGIVQILFKPVAGDWGPSIARAVTDGEGRTFFVDAPEITAGAAAKLAAPLFAVAIRVCALAADRDRALAIVRRIAGSFEQFSRPRDNRFLPLANDDYPDGDHIADVLLRQTRRSGMLLNAEELVSLVHLPAASVRAPTLKRTTERTKAAPATATGNPLVLGENVHQGARRPVSLSSDQRMKHTYVIGASGTGKSTLLLNMIVQDIGQGRGVGVLDPHGDLIDQVLGSVPEARVKDVVLFDPQDTEFPIGFNILSAHSPRERELLASDLVAIFRRFSTSWGDQMNAVFANAILALLESPEGGTLRDLRHFLLDKSYRERYLKTVPDQELVFYWQREFPLLGARAAVPILTRLDAFLRQKTIRHIVAQKENRLDFRTLMDTGQIVLCKLSQGGIGSENAHLLGALLVAKFHQIAMSRQDTEVSGRKDFFLYLDEFHHFVSPSLEALLAGTRKYRLGLILAHQDLRQMLARDREVAAAVLTNAATRVCFRVGDEDARTLQDGFAFFTAADLRNLETGRAICRIERGDHDFNLATLPAPAVDPTVAATRKAAVIAHTRTHYGTSCEQVEIEIASTLMPSSDEPTTPSRHRRQKAAAPTAGQGEAGSVPSNGHATEPPRQDAAAITPEQYPRLPGDGTRDRGTARKPPAAPDVSGGKGGPEHRYLQHLIRKLAEERGFAVALEKPVLDGLGSIDVALEREDHKIACEISVTSTAEYEAGNITKCVSAGYDPVLVVCAHKRSLHKLRDRLTVLLAEDTFAKVRWCLPEEVIDYLDELPPPAEAVQTVGGYKVRVQYAALAPQDRAARKQAIANVLVSAVKRFKAES